MRKLFLSVFAILIISGCSNVKMISLQEEESCRLVISDLDGSKDELFTKANKWLITFSKDADDIIEYRRDDLGVVIGKYNAIPTRGVELSVRIEIRTKDDRAFIELLPLNQWSEKVVVEGFAKYFRKEDAIAYLEMTCDSFEQFMKRPCASF